MRTTLDKPDQTCSNAKPWMECAGELAHLHEETLRIQALIDEEFGQIEADDWL
jgi:hypothetical protein